MQVVGSSSARARMLALSLLAVFAVVALIAVGCGDDDSASSGGSSSAASGDDGVLAKLQEKGEIRMGVSDALPTTGTDKTKPEGALPELAAAVFADMGIPKAVPVPMDFGALIPSLQSGRIDVASAGFYVTAERCRAIEYSEPVFDFYDAFAVKKDNPDDVNSYKDIADKGLKMGSVAGAANVTLAEQAGVAKDKISEYPDLPSLLDALKVGRIDAAPYDNVTLAYLIAKPSYSDDLSLSETSAPIVDGKEQPYAVSVGFAKGETEIADEFDKAAQRMIADGEFDALLSKWKMPEGTAPRPADAPDVATLCKQAEG